MKAVWCRCCISSTMLPVKLLLPSFAWLTVYLICVTSTASAQNFQSPCPQLFTYDAVANETDRWYGTLTLFSESDLLDIWLRLTFDRPSVQLGNWFGQVETADNKEYHIRKHNYELKANVPDKFRFFLKYNSNLPAPQLLSFRLNGKLVCPGDNFVDISNRNGGGDQPSTNFQPNAQNTQFGTHGVGDNNNIQALAHTNTGLHNAGNLNSVADSNFRDKVNGQLESSSNIGDRINTQLQNDNYNGINRQSVTNSRNNPDRVNILNAGSTSHTNNRERLNTPSSTDTSTILGTNFPNRENNQQDGNFKTNSADTGKPQLTLVYPDTISTKDYNTNSKNNPDTNTQRGTNIDRNYNLQNKFNNQDNLNTQPSTSYQGSPSTTSRYNIARDDVCGTVLPQARPLIAYGELTHEGEFPWHSAIYVAKSTSLTYISGASLINRNYVVTTAHQLIKTKPQKSLTPDELIVQLGKYNLKRFSVGYQDRLVSKIIAHPQYSAEPYRNDIALLKLATPANITDFVRPICLWQESTDISSVLNKIGRVVGWGYDEAGQISEELMLAKMPVVPRDKCISSYPNFYTRFITDNSYCGGFANGTSPCNGDAGGGMVFPIPNTQRYNPVWQLRGMVSILPTFQNQNLCDVTHYTIFTDVAKYHDWIAASMK